MHFSWPPLYRLDSDSARHYGGDVATTTKGRTVTDIEQPTTRTDPDRKNTPASRLAVALQRPYDPTKDPTLNRWLGLTPRIKGHGRDTRPGRHHRAVGQHYYRRAIRNALREARLDAAFKSPLDASK